jgi:hypothetical protein
MPRRCVTSPPEKGRTMTTVIEVKELVDFETAIDGAAVER